MTVPIEIQGLRSPEIIRKKRHRPIFKLRIYASVLLAAQSQSFGADVYDQFRRSLRGELPQSDTQSDGILVAACNDLYYWRFATTFLFSLDRQGGHQRIHLHLYQPGDAVRAHIARLAVTLEHISLTWTEDPCELAEPLTYTSVYFAAARFLIANEVLRGTGQPVLCLDIDGIVRRPVWRDFAPVSEGKDVVVFRLPGARSASRRILAGAVGMNPTEAGLEYAQTLARVIARLLTMRPSYHVDQISLNLLLELRERMGRLRVGDLPKSLIDFDFDDESTIWTAKGWRGKDSASYSAAKDVVDSFYPALAAQLVDEPAQGAVAAGPDAALPVSRQKTG